MGGAGDASAVSAVSAFVRAFFRAVSSGPEPRSPRTRSPRLIAATDGVTVFPDAVWNLNPSLAVTPGVMRPVACIVSPPGAPSTSPPNAILARRMASAETATSFPEAVWKMPPPPFPPTVTRPLPNRNSAVSSRNIPRARRMASAEMGVTFFPEAIWKIPAAGEGVGAVSSANRKPPKPGDSLAPPPPPSKPASNANPPTSSAASSPEGPSVFSVFRGGLSVFSDDCSFSGFSEGLVAGDSQSSGSGSVAGPGKFPLSAASLDAAAIRGLAPRDDTGACTSLSSWMYRRGAGVYAWRECTPSRHPGVLSNAAGVYARVPPSAAAAAAAAGVLSVAAGLGYVNPRPSMTGVPRGKNIPGEGA